MLKKSLPLLLVCVVLLSGCAAKLVPLTLEDGKLLNKKQELSYTAAPLRYEATVQGEAYAYCKEEQLTLYAVEGADPTEWLTEEYTGSLTMLFCADSIKLPTFTELDAEKITVCTKGNITVGVMEITDREKIRAAAELFENGTAAEWPGVQSELHYELKFYSSEWPQFSMLLSYGEFAEGNFLYERESKRCVEVGDLFGEYFHSGETAQ